MSFWRPGVFFLVFLPNLSVLVTITVLLINVDYVVFKLSLNCVCDFHESTRLSRQTMHFFPLSSPTVQAASGSLLHALRVEDGSFLAVRGRRVQTFQVASEVAVREDTRREHHGTPW